MKTQLIINNEAVDASNGATFERLNSLTGKLVTQGAAATVADANKAADTAATAFKTLSEDLRGGDFLVPLPICNVSLSSFLNSCALQ